MLKPARGIQINKSHPLSRGLVIALYLNEYSGKIVNDFSGNNNNGQIVTPTWEYDSIKMNGSGNSGIVVNNNTLISSMTSMSLIIKYKVDTTGTWESIAGGINGYGSSRIFGMYAGNGARTQLYIGGATIDMYSGVLLANTYYVLCLTYDGAYQRLYIDGIEEDNDNIVGVLNSGNNNFQSYQWSALHGNINYILLFRRALDASEIMSLYRDPFQMHDRGIRPGIIAA